ncbi:Uncharacterised protein [Afipia felis]|uniref:Uncharacterized protein n=2 Tax=Afipia felis TaxID=1035 RepID=A0A380W6V3_AFIFE|nr:hypothetical protein HMPREF9697_00432 [Afipia felis ATCC 53690]SUU76614.1 Uncharacterised protein [Afipia felis]SUU84680.1 Uncharacterised protein [Afipia felis]
MARRHFRANEDAADGGAGFPPSLFKKNAPAPDKGAGTSDQAAVCTNLPLLKSSIACLISASVFITNGP